MEEKKKERKKRDQNFVGEIKLHAIYSQRKNAHNVQNSLSQHRDHRKAWKVFANELDKSKTICVAKLGNGKLKINKTTTKRERERERND